MSRKMRRLIVNADDLGISLSVNAKIEECINNGLVSSSTLLANAPEFEDGVGIAKKYPSISVGVHLNLIEFKPLTNNDIFRRYGMTDDNGCFIEGAAFFAEYDGILLQAVFEEWDAQISKVEDAGIIPSHVDSHQHTHTIRALNEVLCRVMDKHQIVCVRRKVIPSIVLMMWEKRHPVLLDKSAAIVRPKRNILYRRLHLIASIFKCKRWNRKMAGRYRMTDSFYAFRPFYHNRKYLETGRKSAVVELMCHPGHTAYKDETDELTHIYPMLADGYQLISYRDLKKE